MTRTPSDTSARRSPVGENFAWKALLMLAGKLGFGAKRIFTGASGTRAPPLSFTAMAKRPCSRTVNGPLVVMSKGSCPN